MKNNSTTELRLRFSTIDSSDLAKMLEKDFREYTEEALEVAHKELVSRGIKDIEIPNDIQEEEVKETVLSPGINRIIRFSSYIGWTLAWFLLVGFYGMIRKDLRTGIINFLTNTVGIENIVTIAKAYGVIASIIYGFLFLILGVGFVVITKETKVKDDIAEKKEIALSLAHFKNSFFKDSIIYLLISSPLYLLASMIIVGTAQPLPTLVVATVFASISAFFVISVAGFVFHKGLSSKETRKKEFKRNTLLAATISFFVFILNLEALKAIDIADTATVILAFIISIITLAVYNLLFFFWGNKSVDSLEVSEQKKNL